MKSRGRPSRPASRREITPARPALQEKTRMLREIGKAVSFILSILSLYPLIVSAFFVPGTSWGDRLSMSMGRIGIAACFCFASGLFFQRQPRWQGDPGEPLLRTLPVRMFLWTLAGVAVLFLLSWYLDAYYVPLLWRNQPYGIAMAFQ
jgi:hypothetical protein